MNTFMVFGSKRNPVCDLMATIGNISNVFGTIGVIRDKRNTKKIETRSEYEMELETRHSG